MSNTITAYFKGRIGVAEAVYQNDYGIVMAFDSIDLPAHFECFFSKLNQEEAVPGLGADSRVAIPNSVLADPGNVTIHIPLHTGEDDSEVEYVIYFKVIGRARPIDDGTPTQMTAIERALALLSQPITNIEEIVNEALSFTGDTFAEMKQELQDDFDNYTDTLEGDLATWKGGVESDIDDVEEDFANLQAQFDTAVAAVTTDTEVTNIRVGDDNIIYTTAGEAVRKQFADVKSKLNSLADSVEMLSEKNFAKDVRFSPNYATLQSSSGFSTGTTGLVKVKASETYSVKGDVFFNPPTGCFLADGAKAVVGQAYVSEITFTSKSVNGVSFFTFTVPSSGVAYALLNVVYTDASKTTLRNTKTFHMCEGSAIKELDYNEQFTSDSLIIKTNNIEDEAVTPAKASFFEATSHNLIDTSEATAGLYYSPTSTKIATSGDSHTNGLTGLIPVVPGETYTYSGTGYRDSGGYFGADDVLANNQAAISSITFFAPVIGSGKCFTVPENNNIKYAALNIVKNTTTHEIDTNIQLEVGEMATPVQPYEPVYKIKEEYLPDVSDETVASIDTLPRPSYVSEYNKIENFMAHHMAKDKDLMIVGTGTSLTARSSEHCTLRSDATSRPPLMHSNNFASKIWDRIKWDGQQYRRFDYTDFFTEIGTFESSANDSNWDDANYRYGITRIASGSASVEFAVPEDAWQFNFIYRTDTNGSESVSVAISEGNGKMEVWNGSAWVEANGYTFSMKETAIVLSNIEVCDPNTINNSKTSQSSYQVGGNTTYQKRLKMRCKSSLIDSRDETKTVTISSTSGRLLYWGVEWSPREFMITYVNAARGSHSMTYSSALSLAHFQDNEIWSFKPDLIFTENPIHNSGGAGSNLAPYRTTYWGYSTYDFFFNTDNPTSLASRASHYGITDLEWIIFTSSLSWNFGGIDDNGELKLYEDKDGRVLSALDAQTLCHAWILENEPTVISINACKFWCDAARTLFGNLKAATVGSGKGGSTFTNEGSHWNNTGGAIIDRCVGGIFDFYN